MSNRSLVCILMTLACAFSSAQADLSSSTIIPSIRQTVSTQVRSGWRVVESLRLMAPGISVASKGALSPETGGFRVALDPDTDYALRAVPVSSAIFSSIAIVEKADGQQVLDVQFTATRGSQRRCVTEVVQGVLFLVCTQLFDTELDARLQTVKVLGIEPAEGAPEIMAVKRKALVHPMSLDIDAQPAGVYLQEVAETPLARIRPRFPKKKEEKTVEYSATVYRKVPVPPKQNRLLAFAPVKVEGQHAPERSSLELPELTASRVVVQETPSRKDELARFLGVKFTDEGDREILLPFSGELQFTKIKVNSSQYRIFIPRASAADERLLNTFFVPVDYKGFSALEVAKADRGGLEVLVHVERNAKLRVQRGKAGLRLSTI